jgi:hypothetical protein
MYREAVRARDGENLGKLALGAARKGVLQIFQNAERALEDAGAPKWLCSRSGVLRQCLREDPQQRPKLKSLLETLSSTLRSVRSHNYVPLMWVRKPSGELLRVHSSDKKRLDAAKKERLEVETATPTFTWFRQPPGQGEPARLKQLEAVEVAFAALEASPRPVVEVLDAPRPDAAAGVATLVLSGSPVAATRSGSTSTKRVEKSSSKGDKTRTLSGRFNAAEAQLAADEEGPAPPRSSGRKSRGVSQQEDKNLRRTARACKARARKQSKGARSKVRKIRGVVAATATAAAAATRPHPRLRATTATRRSSLAAIFRRHPPPAKTFRRRPAAPRSPARRRLRRARCSAGPVSARAASTPSTRGTRASGVASPGALQSSPSSSWRTTTKRAAPLRRASPR